MNGIRVQKELVGGERLWVVRDEKTEQILTIGNTVSQAVDSYETGIAYAQIEKELGINPEDMLI